MSSLGNIIQRVKELYRDRKQFEKENSANQAKVDKLVDAVERKIERDFKRKYPDEDARADAWREIDSILEDPKTYAVPDKVRDNFEKSHSSQMSALLGGNYGTIMGVLGGFPVATWLINLLDKVFIKKSLGAKLILISILVAAPASLGFIGNKLGFSIGALKGAVREEIEKKNSMKNKNEQLIESLEYHVSILEEESKNSILKTIRSKIKKNKDNIENIKLGAGLGGTVGATMSFANEDPFRPPTSIERNIIKDRPGKGWKELAKHDIGKMYKRAGKAGLKGAAIGAGIVGAGIATKKAYDHFKNRNK